MEPTGAATLYRTAAALLVLLALTVALSFANLGAFNFPAALLIATAKALLVAVFFMELRAGGEAVWLMAGGAVFWLLLLLAGTLADFMTRAPLPPPF